VLDSRVFDRTQRRVTPEMARLWKNFLTWVNRTQRLPSPLMPVVAVHDFHRLLEIEFEFARCAKTSIAQGFSTD
jgi:hypothetical protein